MFVTRVMADVDLGPVGQSSVSLTSSLRGQLVKCLWLYMYNQIHRIFFLKKWEKLLTFFQQKYWHIWEINFWKFNEMSTNDVVSFEQPDPGLFSGVWVGIAFWFMRRRILWQVWYWCDVVALHGVLCLTACGIYVCTTDTEYYNNS